MRNMQQSAKISIALLRLSRAPPWGAETYKNSTQLNRKPRIAYYIIWSPRGFRFAQNFLQQKNHPTFIEG
jgi:hypothetical protein